MKSVVKVQEDAGERRSPPIKMAQGVPLKFSMDAKEW